MNKLKLKEATQDYVVYFYLPENNGTPGEIRMDMEDDRAFVVSRASKDNSAEHYGFKAAKAVRQCIKEKNLPLEFTQAWY